MCGIAAVFSRDPKALAPLVRRMTDIIRYRGPDGEGFALARAGGEPLFLAGPDSPKGPWSEAIAHRPRGDIGEHHGTLVQAALGHRRLSILDLSHAGHQPMMRADSSLIVTFNGEIYNFVELRAELEGKGHRFSSGSDTEVLLRAFAEWGPRCLDRFNGMFAFVIHDAATGRFFAARDRFGVKPLYYWRSPEGFLAFASEIKQFTVLPGWRAQLDHQRAYDYLAYGLTDHASETFFEGVRQLRGGEMATGSVHGAGSGGVELEISRWYELKPTLDDEGFEDSARRFKELLESSITLRLRSDVPVGVALSGGLDSSSIVCTASELFKKLGQSDLHAFSACARQARFDESKYVQKVVDKTGVKPHYTYPDLNGLFGLMDDLLWHLDEPCGSTSAFAEWKVYELVASQGIKVSLDGHGADEILAGYHAFFLPFYTGLLTHGRWIRLYSELRRAHSLHGYTMSQISKQLVMKHLVPKAYRHGKHNQRSGGWINLDALRAERVSPHEADMSWFRDIRSFSAAQLMSTSLPQQLKWADRNSMAHSIESRAPFLDYRLVEYVMGRPDDYKIGGGQTKRILRKAMERTLPDEIRGRQDKMGFVTPEEHWMKSEAPERFLSAAREAVARSRGVLKPEAVDVIQGIFAGREPFTFLPWRVIAFGAWMERFSVHA